LMGDPDVFYLAELRVRDFTGYRGVYSFLFCRGVRVLSLAACG
jgi:hypothetical protein